jgi:hypothetical protein
MIKIEHHQSICPRIAEKVSDRFIDLKGEMTHARDDTFLVSIGYVKGGLVVVCARNADGEDILYKRADLVWIQLMVGEEV